MIRTCSASHTGYIHVNAFGADTHRHREQKQFQETSCAPAFVTGLKRIGIIKVPKQNEDSSNLKILMHLRSLF